MCVCMSWGEWREGREALHIPEKGELFVTEKHDQKVKRT